MARLTPTMRIAVYGATGRLGRAVVAELAAANAAVTVVGRSGDAVARLAETDAMLQRAAADARDPAALSRAFAGCGVLVNCAPAAACGDALVRAAIAAPMHYVDAAGEQAFIRRIFEDFGRAAAESGAAIVPAMGFDYAIGDCLARLAASGHEPLDELLVAYSIEGA